MYQEVGAIDACVSVAASGALDAFESLTEAELLENMRGKLFGQINLVLLGKAHLADRGSFTLTSGIFADQAWKGVTGGAVVSGALHSFVLSAAIELQRALRINVVSPGMVADAADARKARQSCRPLEKSTFHPDGMDSSRCCCGLVRSSAESHQFTRRAPALHCQDRHPRV